MNKIIAALTAPDKILHYKASFLLLVFTLPTILVLKHFGVHPAAIALFVSGLFAGGAVEATQWADNQNAKKNGLPPPHGVELLDLIASAIFPWLAAVAVQVAYKLDKLPSWLLW